MKRILLTLVAAAAVIGLAVSEASANGPGFGWAGGNNGFGSSNIFDLYRSGRTPIPPYFALNPPVYYSYPVPRTYGYSPFAYSGNVRTPDVLTESQPLEIMNPYVPSSTLKAKPAPSPETTVNNHAKTVQPLVVENPYFSEQSDIYTVSH